MLEIIAQSVEDAKVIEAAGAHRIELVSAISVGGLTPSYGMIEKVVKSVKIPVNVMVRPHGYHFHYKADDLEVMKRDIEVIESLGANGIVIGLLENKQINTDVLQSIETSCKITFNRAIDETDDVLKSYEELMSHNVHEVLTSAGQGKAADNLALMDQLYACNPDKLLIGSGVTLNNLSMLCQRYPKANFHVGSDARVNQTYSNRIDEKHIKLMVDIMNHRK